jgi:CubicO group peptidase (beta-lactamase class C family)
MPPAASCAVLLLLAAIPRTAPIGLPAQDSAGPPLDGVWQATRSFGPALRGSLEIQVSHQRWTAHLAGRSATGITGAGGIGFDFGSDGGILRLETTGDGTPAAAWWVQPPNSFSANGHATPVALIPAAPNRWSGTVRPLDDRLTFFLPVATNADGTVSAFLRNPERNLGLFIGVERLVLSGSEVTLFGHRRGSEREPETVVARGMFDRARDVLSIELPAAGGIYEFTRVPHGQPSDFYPRGYASVPYHYRPPPPERDGWAVDSLEAVGISRQQIEAFIQKLIDMPDGTVHASDIHGVLIARHGKLVLEEYFHGFDRTRLHDTRSAAKSVTSTIAGAVIHSGGASFSVATPVYAAMSGGRVPDGLDSLKRAMTVEHLLTMSSGYWCDDRNPQAPGNEDVMQMQQGQRDWYQFTLELPMSAMPGAETVYCGVDPNLLGGVLARTTGRPVAALFRDLVATPLDISYYALQLMPTGEAYMAGGIYFLPRDFMKLGQMMLGGGVWNGHRIVSQEWVTRASAPIRDLRGYKYGYLWWVTDYPYQGATVRAFFAGGNGGQIVMVVPDLDLVICFWGGNYADPVLFVPQREFVPRDILPAVARP